MNIPEAVRSTIAAVSRKHPNDIKKALEQAKTAVRKLPEFKKYIDVLVDESIQGLLYASRHLDNTALKNSGRNPETKVNGISPGVLAAFGRAYDYHIAGRTLGQLLGEELSGIAESEENVANGHRFNAALCRWLATKVPPGKRVSESVPAKELKRKFDQLCREYVPEKSPQITPGVSIATMKPTSGVTPLGVTK